MRKNKQVRVVVTAVCVMLQITSSASWGGWMSDWTGAASTTSAGPGYINSQTHGYLSGGSLSMRWPVSQNNNLLSTTPPHLSAGCGGINFYAGSIAFLKPDMIVKKLQTILQNSAGVAFQMALGTICATCVTIMNAMENISNKLNSMNMNDCTAAKGIVTAITPGFQDVVENLKEGEFSNAVQAGYVDSSNGITSMMPSTIPTMSDVGSWMAKQAGLPAGTIATLAGCPADIQALIPADESLYPVSVLQVVGGSGQMNLPQSYLDLLRGLAGDIQINDPNGGTTVVQYQPMCSGNLGFTLIEITTGMVSSMDKTGYCPGSSGNADTSLATYVDTKMQDIMTDMATRSTIDMTDLTFISSMPTPVLAGLRMAVMSGQQTTLEPVLRDAAAGAMAMASIKDLITRYKEMLTFLIKTSGFVSTPNCTLGPYSKELEKVITTAEGKLKEVYAQMSISYQTGLKEFAATNETTNLLLALDAQIQAKVANTFGASVAQRAMRSI